MGSITKILLLASALLSGGVLAADKGGGGFATYKWEVNAAAGINLPYDLWGAPGMLSTLALGGVYKFTEKGGIEVGFIYHHGKTSDSAYTGDLAYHYELVAADLNTFFLAGFHYSKFSLTVDRDAAGVCDPENCLTDSGPHTGIFVGAGLLIPLSEWTPLRLSMKFFQNPQLWLLLEAGVGFRF